MDIESLIQNCKKGHRASQRQLYELFAGQMLGVCYRYTKQLEDAEDILQEGFMKVFKHIHTYRHEGEFAGWVRRIMVNTALNYLKAHSRYNREMRFEDEKDQMQIHSISTDIPDALSQLQAKELAELIRELPTGYRSIFNLHAVEGFSHKEISDMLQIKEVTSRTQYFKARKMLIDKLSTWHPVLTKSDYHAG